MNFKSVMMKCKFLVLLFLIPILLQAKPIKVMLLTGQTDKFHNWEVSSAHLKATLNLYEKFETDVVLIPNNPSAMADFAPVFSDYQVVVLNQNGDEWPEKTKKAFVEFVRNGGGLVVIHEANNAFPHWKEYNQICGLGGWKGRNENSGPYYYWKDGEYVKDFSPGKAGKHGKRVPYTINIRDTEHPITRGIPEKWLHQNDELYGNLRGPAENIHVLATAFSDSKTGGTGKEELVLFTIDFGKGRVFHSIMGHTSDRFSDSVQDVGFQVTFLRGTEWAATGKVKQKLPSDFPTETEVLLRDLTKR
jgi:type 1 glutamine amidotransferase